MPVTKRRTLPVVAIVGRANVGKSTLWNRVTESGRAIVSNIPHTTRDRNYMPAIWRGETIELVDTGGLDAEQGSEIGRGILHQAELAIRDADLVLFLVDAKDGAMPQDRDFARTVKRLNKNVILIANKADTGKHFNVSSDKGLWALGLGEPIPCSAATGRGVGDVLDIVYQELMKLGRPPLPIASESGLRVVVMGRPNVGKSSIVNAILGEERVIVSPVAHTTREPMDTIIEWKGERIVLVDTAGMRKRARVEPGLEDMAMERNRAALGRADVALLVVDASGDPGKQDLHLAGLLEEQTKGLALIVNKWDLIDDKTTRSAQEAETRLRYSFPFLAWAPVMFVSAKKHQRTDALLDLALKIRDERRRTITYNALQRFLKQTIAKNPPLAELGTHSPYIHDLAQVGIEPPTFVITVRGLKANVHQNWIRYLEKRLREKFGFDGTPIVVKARLVELRTEELSDEKRGRVNRRKRPIGRRSGGKMRTR